MSTVDPSRGEFENGEIEGLADMARALFATLPSGGVDPNMSGAHPAEALAPTPAALSDLPLTDEALPHYLTAPTFDPPFKPYSPALGGFGKPLGPPQSPQLGVLGLGAEVPSFATSNPTGVDAAPATPAQSFSAPPAAPTQGFAPPPAQPALGGFGRTVSPSETQPISMPSLSTDIPCEANETKGSVPGPALGLGAPAPIPGGLSPSAYDGADSLYFLKAPTTPAAPAPLPARPTTPPLVAPPSGSALPTSGSSGFDARHYRGDFPILKEVVRGRPLIWLDNAATTQKPRAVIERLSHFYEHENSNIHRAAHELASRATDAYEDARESVRRFINAPSTDDIVFLRGTTEAINLVAQSWGRENLGSGDEVIVTHLEHHANIVPWVRLAKELRFTLKVAPVNDRGEIILEEYAKLLNGPVKLVSFTHVSNALGTVTPAKLMIDMAHAAGAVALLDGAQSVSHMPVDVSALGADFFVFSGHKVFGPTGIGVLYGRSDILEAMPPWQGGGNMIEDVTFEKITYAPPPMKFEAGTGNIADAVGLGAALDYVQSIGMPLIDAHEHDLLSYGTYLLKEVKGVKIIGEAADKAGVISFVMDQVSVPDIGKALSGEGIAVRAGHHCAQPILRRMGLEATVRPSLALYNTYEDLDALAKVVRRLSK